MALGGDLGGPPPETTLGAKAATLSRLLREGFDVPAGVVLISEAREAFDAGRLTEDGLASLLSRVRDELGEGPLIVRSSAIGEDGAQASFAGQLDSIADVRGDLMDAVRAVWASASSARCLGYQRTRGQRLEGVAVLVQRQVAAAAAGVLFTRSPNDPTSLLVEYCAGRAEDLVQGRIDPGRVAINRQDQRWTRTQTCSADPLFDDATLRELAQLGLDLETRLGAPQDIEFTLDAHGRLQVVQSRPIASPQLTGPQTESWTNANLNENFPGPITPLLASVAIDGYSALFRNLGRALGIADWRIAAMEPALRRIVGTHCARLYYNLTSIHAVLRLVPGGEFLTGAFNSYTGAESQTDAQPEAASWRGRSKIARALEVAAVGLSTARHVLRLGRRVETFERTADAFASRTTPARLERPRREELAAGLSEFLHIRTQRWTPASLVDASTTVSQALTRALLARALPADDAGVELGALLGGLPNLVSTRPTSELWRLSRTIRAQPVARSLFAKSPPAEVLHRLRTDPRCAEVNRAFEAYLETWGFRCSRELVLTARSFQDDPHTLVPIVRSHVALGDRASPDEVQALRDRERRARTRDLLARVARRRPLLSLGLGLSLLSTQRSIRYRERCRLKQALLYRRLRALALAIGRHGIEQGWFTDVADALFLTHGELTSLLTGADPCGTPALVRERRAEHTRLSAFAPPDAFTLAVGQAGRWSRPAKTDAPNRAPNSAPNSAPNVLRGTGASGGTVRAKAAVLDEVSQADRLTPGDVLVTGQTDPGWGPLFFLIGGLVLERGGLLSHGAILAREYGVPTVVGVKDACLRIRQGQCLTVDGDAGEIRLG